MTSGNSSDFKGRYHLLFYLFQCKLPTIPIYIKECNYICWNTDQKGHKLTLTPTTSCELGSWITSYPSKHMRGQNTFLYFLANTISHFTRNSLVWLETAFSALWWHRVTWGQPHVASYNWMSRLHWFELGPITKTFVFKSFIILNLLGKCKET